LIFGNSGSGKSTLAKALCAAHGLAHLDLDTLAWEPTNPPTRKPLAVSGADIDSFVCKHAMWVIEGCYADLLALLVPSASEMIYMNLPIADCIANARSRPWEPHKYASKAAQDANLGMLVEWIERYAMKDDTCAEAAHRELYRRYGGKKTMLASNRESALLAED
jgi:adenylate kinase family enzyme